MTTTFDRDNPIPPPVQQPAGQRLVEVLLIVLVFFSVAGDPPPHVNEAHYLTRLKHFWNPTWCTGDLFLESSDTQIAFIWLFGWLTRWMSLAATAWIGRIVAWTLIAWAWQRLSWRLVPRPLAAVLSAALFVVLNERAQMAGEWVIGGVEAKCFAYGFVLMALAALVERRWDSLWLLVGAAAAFHPLVGGWSGLVFGVIWLANGHREKSLPTMLPGLVGGGLLALVGIVPALLLTWNESPADVAEASRIYVFERLPHHLALLSLPGNEIAIRLVRHAALLCGLWFLTRALRGSGATGFASMPNNSTNNSADADAALAPMRRIAQFAWGAALIAVVGLVIELALWNDPLAASRLLRYYWFRLTDFAAPMAVALALTALIAAGIERRRAWAMWALTVAIVLTSWHISAAVRRRALHPVPPADAKILDFTAWVEACDWIAKNTPPDALFLTPRLNLTFKWRTGRPEVVNRKDVPQDAATIVEWQRRIKDIYYTEIAGIEQPHDSIGILGTEKVRELAIKYGAKFVLMDRGQLLSLPKVYPTQENRNEEYVVYRIE